MTQQEREYLTVPQFVERHRGVLSKSLIYNQIRLGKFPHRKIGRKVLVPSDALDDAEFTKNFTNTESPEDTAATIMDDHLVFA